ncbi:PD-(D/E)XK nuclease family protein [Hydrogenovibrio thermophilus]|uniref:PD-(D/E)XK endonuclease-like domain-containing protein n=1 Tax=Hydrogenovibrio thermophilus TaxID=265883 RepID=A0A410H4E9_9GAMM|nr:PD-(D/E)XK nuclease family protein [Hydrogenovibrio thermophilus]QAB15803.1 hypothetical protein EPV75_09035 [Hydrogenovibrio thermophilus]
MMPTVHITANSRLTGFLKQALLADQWATQSVAKTPAVMTWNQWWQEWEQEALLSGRLALNAWPSKRLSAFEAQLIWESLVDDKIQAEPQLALLNETATAKQLYQAWCFWSEYFDDQDEQTIFQTDEVRLFLALKDDYQKRLKEQNWQDDVLTMQWRLRWLQERPVTSARFVLHGFDEITPFMQQWMNRLREAGNEVMIAEADEAPARQQRRYAAMNPQDEMQQAALWCAETLQRLGETKAAKDIRIGVVAPNLNDIQQGFSALLDEVLFQRFGQALPLKTGRRVLYNVSLGESLANTPIVQNALQTLNLALLPDKRLSYADWSAWLVSPYTLGALPQRQKADAQLRRLQWASFKWPNLVTWLEQQENHWPTLLPKPLMTVLQKISAKSSDRKYTGRLSLHAFLERVERVLQQFQWGGSRPERALTSIETQQKEAFLECLGRFSQLHLGDEAQNAQAWLNLLKRFVAETVHQPQTKDVVPIQVVGMLEAGGQTFDALWVLGLTDEAWPRPPSPNPFLPMPMQRERAVPRADAQRELQYAQKITRRLAASAEQVVWSYATQLEDRVALPSPLLNLPSLAMAEPYPARDYRSLAVAQYQQAAPIEWEEDAQAPPVPLGERAPGGSGILTAQNKCPLMAFIDFRLGARQQLEDVAEGMRANHLGTLVHEVLEAFWRDVQTQNTLLALDDDNLVAKLHTFLDEAMQPLMQQFDDHYLALEKERITELLMNWLALEKQRPSFKVVAFEEVHTPTIAGIEFKIKIDRVDAVLAEEGENSGEAVSVILDYKTGKASVKDLLKEPIEAPQLAVYLHAYRDAVAGLGYGILHSDDGVRFNTLVADDGVMLKDRSQLVFAKESGKEGGDYEGVTWTDFLNGLRDEVEALAESIQQGRAEMTFRDEKDLAYAAGALALRLPEVKSQLAKAGWQGSEEDA